MRKNVIKNWIRLFAVLAFILIVFRGMNSFPRSVTPQWAMKSETELDDFALLNHTIVLWNGDVLKFVNRKGELIHQEDFSSEGLKLFFGEDRVYLYDSDLNKVHIFSDQGKEEGSFYVTGEVFSICDQNKNTVVHIKREGVEELFILEGTESLEPIFQTEHFILNYDIVSRKKYVVAELSMQASGYYTTLYRQTSDLEKHEFQSEVSMGTKLLNDDIYMVTEKNLYKVSKNDVKSVEIPLISDMIMDKSGVYLLHSGTLSTYDLNLELKDKAVIPANVHEITMVGKRVYGIGTNDMVGNMGKNSEFIVRLPVKEKFYALDKKAAYFYGGGLVQAYKLKMNSPLSKDAKIQEPKIDGLENEGKN